MSEHNFVISNFLLECILYSPVLARHLTLSAFSPSALDDSVLAKLQPVEQMERMQKVLDAWQGQVSTGYTLIENLRLQIYVPTCYIIPFNIMKHYKLNCR